MKVKDVYTRGVITVRDELSIKEAACVMSDYDISGVVVVNDSAKFVGVVSEIDIVRAYGNYDFEKPMFPKL